MYTGGVQERACRRRGVFAPAPYPGGLILLEGAPAMVEPLGIGPTTLPVLPVLFHRLLPVLLLMAGCRGLTRLDTRVDEPGARTERIARASVL